MFNTLYNEQITTIWTDNNWREKDIEIRFSLLVLLRRSFRNHVGIDLNMKISSQRSSRLLQFRYEHYGLRSRRILKRNVSLNVFCSWFLFCVMWVIGILSSLFLFFFLFYSYSLNFVSWSILQCLHTHIKDVRRFRQVNVIITSRYIWTKCLKGYLSQI